MELLVDGRKAYAYTGGKAFDPALPCIVFIHGALHDHSVWNLLARWFAHHGHAVLALDQPAHGRSDGPALPGRCLRRAAADSVEGEVGISEGNGQTGQSFCSRAEFAVYVVFLDHPAHAFDAERGWFGPGQQCLLHLAGVSALPGHGDKPRSREPILHQDAGLTRHGGSFGGFDGDAGDVLARRSSDRD